MLSLQEVELCNIVDIAKQKANRAKAAYEAIKAQYLLVKALYEQFEREYDTADNAFTAADWALQKFRSEKYAWGTCKICERISKGLYCDDCSYYINCHDGEWIP